MDDADIGLHSEDSSLREQYLEFGFLGDLCREMWKRGTPMDVLRSHTDRSGYDILLEAGGIQRHVQLKSSYAGAKTARQKINTRLAGRPSGCVIWVRFDPATLEPAGYLWLGNAPGVPLGDLGDRVGRHTKGDAAGTKAERPGIRVVPKSAFERVSTIAGIADRLFGAAAGSQPDK